MPKVSINPNYSTIWNDKTHIFSTLRMFIWIYLVLHYTIHPQWLRSFRENVLDSEGSPPQKNAFGGHQYDQSAVERMNAPSAWLRWLDWSWLKWLRGLLDKQYKQCLPFVTCKYPSRISKIYIHNIYIYNMYLYLKIFWPDMPFIKHFWVEVIVPGRALLCYVIYWQFRSYFSWWSHVRSVSNKKNPKIRQSPVADSSAAPPLVFGCAFLWFRQCLAHLRWMPGIRAPERADFMGTTKMGISC